MKNTTKSWKRRKHRNGIRPQRKGSLKINLKELPTAIQHFEWINDKLEERMRITSKCISRDSDIVTKVMNMYFERGYKEAKRFLDTWTSDGDLHDLEWKALSKVIKMGQRANDLVTKYRQVSIEGLALMAINDEQPNFHGSDRQHKMRNTCLRCPYRDDCPFSSIGDKHIEYLCSFIRLEKSHGIDPFTEPSILKQLKPDDQVLNKSVDRAPFIENAQLYLS